MPWRDVNLFASGGSLLEAAAGMYPAYRLLDVLTLDFVPPYRYLDVGDQLATSERIKFLWITSDPPQGAMRSLPFLALLGEASS